MKPFINIFILFLYLASIAGLPVEVHYCRGDVVSVDILTSGEDCCCHETAAIPECCSHSMADQTCSLENAGECCSNQQYLIQYFDDRQFTKSTNADSRSGNEPFLEFSIQFSDSQGDDSNVYARFYDLPPPKTQPLWLLHCTFTFYG